METDNMLEVIPEAPEGSAELEFADLDRRAEDFARASKADSTLRRYAQSWKAFFAWCAAHEVPALPASPADVARYLVTLADQAKKAATIELALVAIAQAHKLAGLESPRKDARVQAVRVGIRRRLGVAQRHVAPLLAEDLRALLGHLPSGPLGIRDAALLLLGFGAALRRSELVALDVEDLELVPAGVLLQVRRSKTDQEGQGRTVAVPRSLHPEVCPVVALERWLQTARISTGAIFVRVDRHENILLEQRLCAQAVALVVKRHVDALGMKAERFSGHSLRAGLVTAAARAGKAERLIMRHTGHQSLPTLRRYIRDADPWTENAARDLL
jgi:integrase